MTDVPSSTSPAAWKIRLAIWAAFAIGVGSATILYYKYLVSHQPNCVLVIHGNRNLDQNVVTVEGAFLLEPIKVTLNADNHYSTRIFLDSAAYHVTVINPEKPEKPLLNDHTFIAPGFRQDFDLNRLYPETQPTHP